jgi:hypothetical protein
LIFSVKHEYDDGVLKASRLGEKMKALVLTLIFPVSLFANCLPTEKEYEGVYLYKEYIPASMKSVEIVKTGRAEGENRLDDLNTQGYTCTYVQNSTYRCQKTESFKKFPELTQKLTAQYEKSYISFFRPLKSIQQTNESHWMKEWELKQTVVVDDKLYEEFNYLELRGISKLKFDDKTWFNVQSCEKLSKFRETRFGRVGKYTTFSYHLIFKKI